jgi:hypothetical protein
MSDSLFDALSALLACGGPFGAALRHGDSARAAMAGALESVDAQAAAHPPVLESEGSNTAVGALESMIRFRLQDAYAAGELSAEASVEDLAAFYTSVVLGLLAEAVAGGTPQTLGSIRRMAMRLWPIAEAALV